MKYIKVTTVEQLNELISNGNFEYCISNGLFKSSKLIQFGDDDKTYSLYNEIDDTEDNYTLKELINSNIGEAINNGCLFAYYWD